MTLKLSVPELRNTIYALNFEEAPLGYHLADISAMLQLLQRNGVDGSGLSEMREALDLLQDAKYGLHVFVDEMIAFLERYNTLNNTPLPLIANLLGKAIYEATTSQLPLKGDNEPLSAQEFDSLLDRLNIPQNYRVRSSSGDTDLRELLRRAFKNKDGSFKSRTDTLAELKKLGISFNSEPQMKYGDPRADLNSLRPHPPDGSQPLGLRMVNGKVVYDEKKDGFLYDQNLESLLLDTRLGYNARMLASYALYTDHLDQEIKQLELKYRNEVGKEHDLNPMEGADRDYALLLAQTLNDMQGARWGTKLNSTSAELKIVTNYLRYGTDYINGNYPKPSDNAQARPTTPPDNNYVFYISGFNSNWENAVNDAYDHAYNSGYSLDKIYVFNYNSGQPILLSDVLDEGRNIRMDEFGKPLILSSQTFSHETNLSSSLKADAMEAAQQLKIIQSQLAAGKRINLIGNSQGGAIAVAMMAQRDGDNFIMDDGLNTFVDKYAFTVSAQGGSYLAQAAAMSQAGSPTLAVGSIQIPLSMLELLKLVSNNDMLNAHTLKDLTLDSDFIQANYAALQDPQVQARLKAHQGVEIYAGDDDITTSASLLSLPGSQVTYVAGEHSGIFGGANKSGEKGRRVNDNIYNNFNQPDTETPNLFSDQQQYYGYVKKGYPDLDLLTMLPKLPIGGTQEYAGQKLQYKISEATPDPITGRARIRVEVTPELHGPKLDAGPIHLDPTVQVKVVDVTLDLREIVPISTGRAGVVDYAIQKQVYTDLGKQDDFKLKVPTFWPSGQPLPK